MSKPFLWILLFLYLSLVTKLILFKNYVGTIQYSNYHGVLTFRQNLQRANFVPFKTLGVMVGQVDTFVIQNILGNVFLFIPLGILLPILIPSVASFSRISIAGIALSAMYEVIQLIKVYGIFDVDDIILNSIGAVIGFIIYKQFSHYRKAI
jgi:glycopeptide antibiotics resistance protein